MSTLIQLQNEFSLLIKTLNLIQSLQKPEETVSSVIKIFDNLKETLINAPPISLSAFWEKKGSKSLVSKPSVQIESIVKNDDQHDPLKIIQYLSNKAKSEFSSNSLTGKERGILISFFLLLGVKSGRVTLLLDALVTLLSDDNEEIDISPTLLRDLLEFISKRSLSKVGDISIPSLSSNSNVTKASSKAPNISDLALGNSIKNVNQKRTDLKYENIKAKAKHTLLSFGKADHGKLGHGEAQIQRSLPTMIEKLKDVNIVKTASMSTYSLALDDTGRSYVWGTGGPAGSNQGHRTDLDPQILEALPSRVFISDISCGLSHTLFLTDAGRIYSWGNGGLELLLLLLLLLFYHL